MSKPCPPIETRFKPGQSGNPGGRPRGLLRKDDVQALMGRFWHLDREGLQKVVSNPKSTMGEIMVASVMAKAAKDGDYGRLSFLLDRMIGKPVEVVEQHNVNHDDKFKAADQDKLLEILKKTG